MELRFLVHSEDKLNICLRFVSMLLIYAVEKTKIFSEMDKRKYTVNSYLFPVKL